MSIKSSYTLTISLFAITIPSGIFLSSNIAFATDSTTSQDNVTVSVPVSCTMNGTGMTSHNANIPNGTYQADIGTTTLKSFCNDNQGFAIYAIGYTNEEYGNTTLIGATGGQTIVTGTATTTGSPDVSNWAVKLATDSTATYPLTLDNSFGAYSSVPSSYTKVAHRDSGTDLGSSATGAELTTTYAAYISKTQQADTYNGEVKYTLVHPASEVPLQPVACEASKICYNANGSNVVGEMGKQGAYSGTRILYAPNYKRDGYGFAGWNDKFDYTGTTYGPNQTITVTDDIETNGLSLYAIWIKSAGILQNWSGCSGMSVGDVTALTDNRDNDTYAIAKLADNKCWMIENLRLADKDANNNDINLSSINTHNPSLPLTNSWYYYDTQTSITTSNHLSPTTDPTQVIWCDFHGGGGIESERACTDQSMLATNNTTFFIDNYDDDTSYKYYDESSNVYSYGNYYNWYSATAGHGKLDNNSGYIAPGDICPAGWHLPTGGTIGEFYNLNMSLNNGNTDSAASNKIRSYPNNLVLSGHVLPTSYILDRGSHGYYLTSTAFDGAYSVDYQVYSAHIAEYNIYPGTIEANKYEGQMIRCVSDNI